MNGSRAITLGMRRSIAIVLMLGGVASADTFGGFSGVRDTYQVNADRVCEPLPVKDGAAAGMPACEKATTDELAHLSVKAPIAQRGAKASFVATASARVITVARGGGGEAVATWEAPDTVGKIVEVYATQYGDRVAVAYTMRRLGREVTEVVGFKL